MARTADFVIVGGGIIGASIAYHLAKRKAGKIVVLEQATLGSGSTSKAAGGIRAQFGAEVSIRMSLYAQDVYRNFEAEFGVTADYKEVGYLFLLSTIEELDAFRHNVALQNSMGVPSRLIKPDEIAQMVPSIQVSDLAGASFCGTDGTAGPSEALGGFVRRGRDLGVELIERSPVMDIGLSGQQIQAVRTEKETFHTPVVINAAGPWAARIGALVGLDLPVRPLKRHIWITEPFDLISRSHPPGHRLSYWLLLQERARKRHVVGRRHARAMELRYRGGMGQPSGGR